MILSGDDASYAPFRGSKLSFMKVFQSISPLYYIFLTAILLVPILWFYWPSIMSHVSSASERTKELETLRKVLNLPPFEIIREEEDVVKEAEDRAAPIEAGVCHILDETFRPTMSYWRTTRVPYLLEWTHKVPDKPEFVHFGLITLFNPENPVSISKSSEFLLTMW